MMILSTGGALLGKPAITTAHEKTQITGTLNVSNQWFDFPLMTDTVSEVMGLEVQINRKTSTGSDVEMQVVDGAGNVLWSGVFENLTSSEPDVFVALGSEIVTGNTITDDYRLGRSLVGEQGLTVRLKDERGNADIDIWFEGVGYGA